MTVQKPKRELRACQYYFPELERTTSPDPRTALPLRRLWWQLKKLVWHVRVQGPFVFAKKTLSFKVFGKRAYRRSYGGPLNLQPGELVEVRSEKEIFDTLDTAGKYRGLSFNPEMTKYCGKRFRVYKRLEKIILETTGELRKVKTPTVFLEGLICDGESHGGCDRSCFFFWREVWLKRVDSQESERQNVR